MGIQNLIREFLDFFRNEDEDNYEKMAVHEGIGIFISSGTADIMKMPFIGAELQDVTVPVEQKNSMNDDYDQTDSACNCDRDGTKSTLKKGVKVTAINFGSFAHGIGLRENDVIFTVNDTRVQTAEIADFIIRRLLEVNKNARLALEIERFEKGFLKLDNGGDVIEIEEVFQTDNFYLHESPKFVRFKNTTHIKYLTASTTGNITLSKFTTPPSSTHFIVQHYRQVTAVGGEVVEQSTIQVKSTMKYLFVQGSTLSIQDAPTNKNKLPINSGYLFKITSPTTDGSVLLKSNVNDKAIGFTSKTGIATLLDDTSSGTKYNYYSI